MHAGTYTIVDRISADHILSCCNVYKMHSLVDITLLHYIEHYCLEKYDISAFSVNL